MNLRYYQYDAVKSVLDYLKNSNGNPCLELPTGAGKTPVIATLCGVFARANARTLCVAHRKELLQQTAEKLKTWEPDVKFSIVSAGLNQRDFSGQVVIAGIQSVYKNAQELLEHGIVNFLIVDEAHLIPSTEENAEGMYQTLIKELRSKNPKLRIIGLTATPYRLNSGLVCGEDKILTEISYKVSIPELIGNNFLSPLISKAPPSSIESYDFHIEHGEFKSTEVNEVFNVDSIIYEACSNIVKMTKNRKSTLIFCCSKDHCRSVAETLNRITNDEVGIVLGDTPASERETLIRRFKGDVHQENLLGDIEKPLKYLANVEVLTTGFDAPNVDCVALLRPTASPGLYYQMCGRGLRLSPGKKDCLILDFGGNIMRFGGLDKIEPPEKKAKKKQTSKVCPICFEVIDINARICPSCGNKIKCDDFYCPCCNMMNDLSANFCFNCGFQFRELELPKHDSEFDQSGAILSTNLSPIVIEEQIVNIQYFIHNSKKSGKTSLRVDYKTPNVTISEYVCLEHEGFAKQKAMKWWCERSRIRPIPYTVEQAYQIIDLVGVAEPTKIKYLPKKPKDFQPEIVEFDIEEPKEVPDRYPHTDNPLNLECECGSNTFLYMKENEKRYYVLCALCNRVVMEISPDSCNGVEYFKDDLAAFADRGIAFYHHNDGLGDFYKDIPNYYEDNDLPF